MGQNSSKVKLYKELDKIFYLSEEEGSYGGIENLLRAATQKGLRVAIKTIKGDLGRQASYSLHKPSRKNFKRNPTVVGGIDKQWQRDLADMQALSTKKVAKFILTVIAVFSKFAWAIPVKNKGGREMKNAFEQLFKISNPLMTDKL